jgi:uncharacterized metal-binding protein YceD (DUF177 family)
MSEAPFSEAIRLNQIGPGLERVLTPDEAARKRIARALDLQALSQFQAELSVTPNASGWRLDGRLRAEAVQTCGLTLEPLPVSIDAAFSILMVEASDDQAESDVVEIDIDLDDDTPDVIEDGRIDLGRYAVEQLALNLDPFPRKQGAVFVQPEETAEISPFAALKALKRSPDAEGG